MRPLAFAAAAMAAPAARKAVVIPNSDLPRGLLAEALSVVKLLRLSATSFHPLSPSAFLPCTQQV